jgi:hypothetical protein
MMVRKWYVSEDSLNECFGEKNRIRRIMEMSDLRLFSITLVVCLLVACSPSQQGIQTAIAKTREAIPTATFVPTSTITPTVIPTLTPTIIPASYMESEFLYFNWEPCGFGLAAGVFDDGVTYKCFYEPGRSNTVSVGKDGTLRFVSASYKASSFSAIDKDQIIASIFGSDVYAWVNDNVAKAEEGKQEDFVGAFVLTLCIAQEKLALPGSDGEEINLILEVVPFGAETHLFIPG